MDPLESAEPIRQLADRLAARGLTAPVRLLLDIIAPVTFLASQAATFTRPLVPYGRWRSYVAAFEREESWTLLREMVNQRDR